MAVTFQDFSPEAWSGNTVENLINELANGDTIRRTDFGAWIEIKPTDPDASRNERVDRPGLARLLTAARKKGIPGLDDFIDFAMVTPDAANSGLSQFAAVFVPDLLFVSATDWSFYRVFGEFGPDRRQEIENGLKVPVASMSLSQQATLTSLIFGGDVELHGTPAATTVDGEQPKAD